MIFKLAVNSNEKLTKDLQIENELIEKLTEENERLKNKVRTITHEKQGNINKKNIIKYRLGIEIKAYVEKHVFQ